jgi:fatty acid desaturase
MKLFEFIEKALSEDNGNPSSMRVKTMYAAILLVTVIAFGFIYTVLNYPDLIIAYLTSGVVSIIFFVLGAKVWQKGKEK